jgi:hypothetical protein
LLRGEQLRRDRQTSRSTTRCTGTVVDVTTADGAQQQYSLSYDEAPQDKFLATSAKEGTDLPAALIEPVT